MEYCTHSSIYLACSRAASCFSCLVGVIPSYLYNSLAASLIMVFIALQLARYSTCGCMPLFIFLIRLSCSHDVILYISRVLRIYIASKLGTSFLLSIMLRFKIVIVCFGSLCNRLPVLINTGNLIVLMFRSFRIFFYLIFCKYSFSSTSE